MRHLFVLRPIAQALQKPFRVNNSYCVPYRAGRSVDDDETYIDRHVPRFDDRFRTRGGEPGDIWRCLACKRRGDAQVGGARFARDGHYYIFAPHDRGN